MLEEAIRRWNPWWGDEREIEELAGLHRSVLTDILDTLKLRHIKDVIGVRRAGKSTTLYQVISALIKQGIKQKDIVFLNFDDPEINAAEYDELEKSMSKINPDLSYLFLDEAQQKKGWERWIRTLYDTKAFKQIFVSGSSASLLSGDIGRVLTGRHITFAIFPFSFKEFLKFRGWKDFDSDFLVKNSDKLLHLQLEYLESGGFPEVQGIGRASKEIVLTNIYTDILSRDISARFGAPYESVKRVAYHLLSNVGREFSYRSVARAANLSVEATEKYIAYLGEAFILINLEFFSYKTKVQFRMNKKAYSIDPGLRNAVGFRFSKDFGRLAENVIFLELKRRGFEVYYWKDQSGKEVDFLVQEGTKVTKLIQSCWEVTDQKTKKREVSDLLGGLKKFGLSNGLIITEDFDSEETIDGKTVVYKPLWKWLIGG